MKTRLWIAVAVAAGLCAPAVGRAQVVFNYGPLQSYLDGIDPGINVVTGQQWFLGGWFPPPTGNTEFTLTLKRGNGADAAIGLYHYDPILYQVFPPGAVAGWYAVVHFGGTPMGQDVFVSLFDENSVFQGQTIYHNVYLTVFGFYIQGPCGTWFTDPHVNHPQVPQAVLYNSPSVPGDYWLCFEACPYDPATSTFDGVVLNIQSVRPTPAASATWGRVKGMYH